MGGNNVWLIISLILYFGILLGISFYKNKNDTKEDYFLGGYKTPYWILAMSFVASWYGGTSSLISIDEAFKQGLSSWWILGGPTVAAVIIIMIFASAIRRVGSMSQNGIMTKRYNQTTGNILSVILVLYFISWGASQMVAIGQFLAAFFGISFTVAVIIGVVISLIYSTLGGFRAVVLTEMVQFFILVTGLCITMIVALMHSGGWSEIQVSSQAQSTDGYFDFFGGFILNITFIISIGLANSVDGSAWQRISASKSPKDARKTAIQALMYFIPLYFFVTITGMASSGLFKEAPAGGIVPALIEHHLNPVLGSIVFVGVTAAIMSTMCTGLNASSMYLTEIYFKYVKPNSTNKQTVRFGMLATFCTALIGIIIAIRIPDALHVLTLATQILAAGIFVPLIFGFLWRRATSTGAISSIIGGSSFIVYNFLIDLGIPLPTFWASDSVIIIGVIISLVLYFVGSLLSKPNYQQVDKFFAEARPSTRNKYVDTDENKQISQL